MLRSNLCHYSDTYIVVKATVDVLATAENKNDKAEKQFNLKIMHPLGRAYQKANNISIIKN